MGPCTVILCDEKSVAVETENGKQQHFNIVNVRPFLEDDTIISSADGEITQTSSGEPDSYQIRITQILQRGDPRLKSRRVIEARRKEIRGLISKNAFLAVSNINLPKDSNVLNGRFVDALKNPGTPDEICKSRFVAGGHRDKDKNYFVHRITTLSQTSTRVVVALAAVFNLKVWSHDVTLAYIQSDEPLS